MRRDHERDVAARLGEQRVERAAAGLVEAAVRLVQHEQPRLREQRAGEREPLALALRERGGRPLRRLRETGRRERALGRLGGRGRRGPRTAPGSRAR